MKVVKYSCGCIGFEPSEKFEAIIISHCLVDPDRPYSITSEMVKGVEYSVLTEEERGKILMDLRDILNDGYDMRIARQLFKP